MSKTCILTDSSVLFSNPEFKGHEFVTILPLRIQVGDQVFEDYSNMQDWPNILKSNEQQIRTLAPSVDDFSQAYLRLGYQYDNILTILMSSKLSSAVQHATEAVDKTRASAAIRIIDSLTMASGLGFLVEAGAEAIAQNLDSAQIFTLIRGMIPHVYTILCLQNLSSLANAGKLDPEQALISEMMNIIPLFIIENGNLLPVQKARSTRQVIDILDEFVSEFEKPQQVAIVQGMVNYEQEIRYLKDRLLQMQTTFSISEHRMGPALVNLLGLNSLGVFTLE